MMTVTQTTLPLTLGQLLAKSSPSCDMPCSKAKGFQSWGVTLDLPAPALLQPHSHQLFINILSPANWPQLFIPNQTNPIQHSLCTAYELCYHLQRAKTSPNTCFTFWMCLPSSQPYHGSLGRGRESNPQPLLKKQMLCTRFGIFR